MSTKVFRLQQNGGKDTIEGWGESQIYGTMAISEITDPSGGTNCNEITSIPSPFARIDLVKTAFREVVKSGDLNGKTIYHKLVSDCFDVGELFFNFEKYRSLIDIIVWNKREDIAYLVESANDRHRLFGETLKIYLSNDAQTYNFDLLDRMFLLNYKYGPKPLNIIGGTSPATFFFTPANDLSFVAEKIRFGNDFPFDDYYNPLYNRDEKYVKYWFSLRNFWSLYASNPDRTFATLFPEVNQYIDLTYGALSERLRRELHGLTRDFLLQEGKSIPVNNESNVVELFGFELKQKKASDLTSLSDFVIDCKTCPLPVTPLVLPVDIFSKQLVYTLDFWDRNINVPYSDERSLMERTLPGDGSNHPYLTMGDFLEDTLILNQYGANNDYFYDGDNNIPAERNESFLLPLKRTFFDYFSVEDALQYLKMEYHRVSDLVYYVKAILRIPIKNSKKPNASLNYIIYEKKYIKADRDSLLGNDGTILEKRFTMGMFPHLKFADQALADYRVVTLSKRPKEYIQASFYTAGNRDAVLLEPKHVVRRNSNEAGQLVDNTTMITPTTYVVNACFDYVQLEIDGKRGLVVPIWAQNAGYTSFSFAIDFGTSNTHIEYSVDGKDPKPFVINQDDLQMRMLNANVYKDTDVRKVMFSDLIPDQIGQIYKLPIRTVLSEQVNTNWRQPFYSMATGNVPFVYEKLTLPKYNKLKTSLKWSTEEGNKERIKCYLGSLFMLLRNKVLMNGGNLPDTKIVWFYPASMDDTRVDSFKKIWVELYKQYFGGDSSNVIRLSESVAPYFYYKNKYDATTNVCSIDIGGGTTDVLFVKDGSPTLLTSFRFAANAIFGDGFIDNVNNNGFIKKYESIISNKLADNNLEDLILILRSIKDNGISTDVITFFFSLLQNADVPKEVEIDFNEMLREDDKFKIVFVIFYAAIIYHIARVIQVKKMPEPRYIAFSGTGSKVLQVLVNMMDEEVRSSLERYTKLIFEYVLQRNYDRDGLDIIFDPDLPKEATCKGGLKNPNAQSLDELNDMKIAFLGDENATFATVESYKNIPDSIKDGVIAEVEQFFEMLFKLDENFSYRSKFGGISSENMAKLRPYFERDLRKYLNDGINMKLHEIEQTGGEYKICESLFFYPIIGVMNTLAKNVNK